MDPDHDHLPQFLREYNELLDLVLNLRIKNGQSGKTIYTRICDNYFIMWVDSNRIELGRYCFTMQPLSETIYYWNASMKWMNLDQYQLAIEKLHYTRNVYNQLICCTTITQNNKK